MLAGVLLGSTPARCAPVEVPEAKREALKKVQSNPTNLKLVWVAWEGYQPRSRWSETAPAADHGPTAFVQAFFLLLEHSEQNVRYALLGEGNDLAPIGWVRSDCLVHVNALQDPQTHLYRKAMLVVKPEHAKEPNLPPRVAPRADAAPRGEPYKLYNVFFVFAESNLQNLYDREEEYVLIGSAQTVKSGTVAKTIQGWVPKNRVEYWTTTEAVAWDVDSTLSSAPFRRQKPGYIYKNAEAAERAIQAGADPRKEALFPEPRDKETGEGVPYNPHQSRFPLFVKPDRVRAHNYLLEVGGVGGWGNMSSREVDDLKQQLGKMAREFQSSELLFVIDSTSSMAQYRESLAKVADTICRATQDELKRLREEEPDAAPTFKMGVAFFSDIPRPQDRTPGENQESLVSKAVTTGKLAKVHENGIDPQRYEGNLAEYIRKYPQRDGHDYPESVFFGLKKAIQEAGFDARARKLVVLVGDCGDAGHRDDFPKPPSLKELADLFCPDDELDHPPYELYALQVCDPNKAGSNDEERAALQAFAAQMQELCKLINARSEKWIKRPTARYEVAATGAISRSLESRYEALKRQLAHMRSLIEKARSGQLDHLGPEMIAELRMRGIDPETLPKETQLFQRGFVWKYAPDLQSQRIRQVRIQYLLDHKTLSALHRLLDDLGKVTPDGREITLEDAFREAVDAYAREMGLKKVENESAEVYIKKATGLEVQTPLLRQALNANIPKPQEYAAALAEIEYRKRRLADILEGKQRQWKLVDVKRAGCTIKVWQEVPRTELEYDRSLTLPGSPGKWYWVDQDEAP
jgi:hypothetical protein